MNQTLVIVILSIILFVCLLIIYKLANKVKRTEKMRNNFSLENEKIKFHNANLSYKIKNINQRKNEVSSLLEKIDKQSFHSLLKGKKILIVDDHQPTAEYNKEILVEMGLEVDIVLSGKECIDKIYSNTNYDIIFMDNQMPQMNGPEVLKELKNIEYFTIPVVIVTGDEGRDYFITEMGFDEYIQKPINQKIAEEAIMNLLY